MINIPESATRFSRSLSLPRLYLLLVREAQKEAKYFYSITYLLVTYSRSATIILFDEVSNVFPDVVGLFRTYRHEATKGGDAVTLTDA